MKSVVFDGPDGKLVRSKRTICEVHREIYDTLIIGNLDAAIKLLEEAFDMGRRMADRMIEQKIYDIDAIAAEDTLGPQLRKNIRRYRLELQGQMTDKEIIKWDRQNAIEDTIKNI